jgi:ribonuclease HII
MKRVKKRQPIPNGAREESLRAQGFALIAGVDEVGRGAWAGPLVMAAVILKTKSRFPGLKDSKLLSVLQREKLAPRIRARALVWALGIVDVDELNQFGLGPSLHLAAKRAVDGLSLKPDYVLVDGKHRVRGLPYRQQAIIRGDQTVMSIAAASVVAKVARDELMRDLHAIDPTIEHFHFHLNKGYPSPHHRAQLRLYGPSPYHRRTFIPIQAALNQKLFD